MTPLVLGPTIDMLPLGGGIGGVAQEKEAALDLKGGGLGYK